MNSNFSSLLASYLKAKVMVPLFISLLLLFWLVFVQGYSTGYFDSRDPLWEDMKYGYARFENEWSFGYFVPFAVGLLAWVQRREFSKLAVEPSLWGALILGVGFFFYFGGYRANVTYIGFAGCQLVIAGLLVWFLGWNWFRKAFWLWLLFGMFWPFDFLIKPISFPLRMIMVHLTSGYLNLTGVHAIPEGTEILTDTLDPKTGEPISLNIAIACSGLRSLFALIMIGLVFAALMLKTDWKRLVLMLCIPLVAIAGNFVRMLMLYYGSRFGGTKFAIGEGHGNESSYHIGSGLVIFVVALILVTLLVEILNQGFSRFFRKRKVRSRVVRATES